MTKGITHQEINDIVDCELQKMFNGNEDEASKAYIKKETLVLAQFFIDIITEFNLQVKSGDFVDRVLNKMDSFASAYEKLLNSIPEKHIASSVGLIWYGFFATAISELNNNVSDKMLFESGESKIEPILSKITIL